MGRKPMPDREQRWVKFCEAVSEGFTIEKSCKEAAISWGTVCRWITVSEDADSKTADFARARSTASHRHASRIIEIIDNATPETAQVDRMKVDALKWLSAVQNKNYSEKISVDATVRSTVTGVIMLPAEDMVILPTGREVQPSRALLPAGLSQDTVYVTQGEADAGIGGDTQEP